MLEKLLEKLGLSEKEARVYLTTLGMGQATVQQIAEKAQLPRPTVYFVLDSLRDKGLATTVEQGKKVLYAVEPPQQLDRFLERERDRIEERREDLEKALPELKAVWHASEHRPRVKFYEGKEGLRASTWEFIRDVPEGSTIYAFTPLDDMLRVIPDYTKVSPEERKQKKIRTQVIYTHRDGPLATATDPTEQREARFVPKDRFPMRANLNIVPGKKIGITALGDTLMGIIIESPELADTWKAMFDLAWEGAAKYQ